MTGVAPGSVDADLGRWLMHYRLTQDLSQHDVAEMVNAIDAGYGNHLAWNQAAVSRIETGKRKVSVTELIVLARWAGLTVNDLLVQALCGPDGG